MKNYMKAGAFEAADENPYSFETPPKLFKLITKKPVTAGGNGDCGPTRRSRSAKLRVAEKI